MEIKRNRHQKACRLQARQSWYHNSAVSSPWRKHLKDVNVNKICVMKISSCIANRQQDVSLDTVIPINEIIQWTEPM